ncbi:MAG: histidinol dehydrogenase, partial [Actinobacteria bacterium]|nr:histidinol dehydrogenase [Actinomycetota bacterium]
MSQANLVRTLDLRGKKLSKAGYQELLPRAEMDIASALSEIEPIIESVR